MIEQVLKRKNLYKAYRKVVQNKVSAGMDGRFFWVKSQNQSPNYLIARVWVEGRGKNFIIQFLLFS
ncbi:MAG: hypothetical protein HLUCCX10_03260 [Algoriphagus marincola HL-49]|uniref:Uncharacterized protein n=1 Tax=Algoriphagus marincola HL-49 TaxID=1305737 RepID=A0A0P7XQG7_9BACT|nr:MAG: hypothetical protein HLUCCX10_03260 [Algoriphagus marincola HL-49]